MRQRIEKSKGLALQFVKDLPFVVGNESLTEARRHLWLAFGRGSPDLFKCSDQSIAYAIALSAMSGLYPGGPRPDVWLIPRYSNAAKCLECNWQISSRGYQRMAATAHYRTRAYVVHDHDKFEIAQGSAPAILHEPHMGKAGTWDTIMCAYITVVDTDGRMEFAVLRKDQIEKRRAKAQHDGIWTEWPEEQTLKTMHAYAGAREMWPTDGAARHAMAADQQPVQAITPTPVAPALTPGDFDPPDQLAETYDQSVTIIVAPITDELSEPDQQPIDVGDGLILKATRWRLEKAIKEAGNWDAAVHDCAQPWRQIDLEDLELYTKEMRNG